MRDDPIEEALRLLVKRRDEALAEVQRIEKALVDLGRPVTNTEPTRMTTAEPVAGANGVAPIYPPSVRGRLVFLLDEADRDWSVGEVIAEYERRGIPFTVKAPDNALRAALLEAQRKGQVERTAPGRYRSTKFAPGQAGIEWRGQEVIR
jgi:hypothetical protein